MRQFRLTLLIIFLSHISGFGQNCDSLLQKANQEKKLNGFMMCEKQYLNILSICPNHYEVHSEIIKFYETFYTAIPIFALLWQNLIDFKSVSAKQNIDKINYLSHRYLEVKKKGTTVHVPPKFVNDWDADYENNMSPLDAGLIVTGAIDFSPDHKNLNSAEKMVLRFDKLFLKIDTLRTNHHGLYWDLYVDFFANLYKTEQFKTAMYIIMYKTGETEIQAWVDNNTERISDFYDERNSFISKFIDQQKNK